MKLEIIKVRKPLRGLDCHCNSGWSRLRWPAGANTLVALFDDDRSPTVITHLDIQGWPAGDRLPKKQGWHDFRRSTLPPALYYCHVSGTFGTEDAFTRAVIIALEELTTQHRKGETST